MPQLEEVKDHFILIQDKGLSNYHLQVRYYLDEQTSSKKIDWQSLWGKEGNYILARGPNLMPNNYFYGIFVKKKLFVPSKI